MFFRAYDTRILGISLGLFLLFGLTGCSWFGRSFEDPEVQLTQVDLVKARLWGQEFLLHFQVENPNSRELPIRGLSYTVYLEEIPLAHGETGQHFTVPANGSKDFTVPVQTNLWRYMKDVVRMIKRTHDPIHYRLDGEIKTGLMFGRSVYISRSGEIVPNNFLPE
ncbi:LEA14-like dessication related protein [Pseudomonas duriflava]|uniref:LEA14-like dessication related protein n=1 Tax=Pseudomonas duriflava TaxID=459528 RepID=A0A562Q8F9_9PSED|nr:LEA type 2 family protein [Pseudomonas duriflava]TWI53051.1 LEA14-like dessication related protein [Pseudomonas duriflava]